MLTVVRLSYSAVFDGAVTVTGIRLRHSRFHQIARWFQSDVSCNTAGVAATPAVNGAAMIQQMLLSNIQVKNRDVTTVNR